MWYSVIRAFAFVIIVWIWYLSNYVILDNKYEILLIRNILIEKCIFDKKLKVKIQLDYMIMGLACQTPDLDSSRSWIHDLPMIFLYTLNEFFDYLSPQGRSSFKMTDLISVWMYMILKRYRKSLQYEKPNAP